MLKRFSLLTLLGTSLLLDTACAGRTAAWEQEKTAGPDAGASDASATLVAAGDAAWAERDTLEKIWRKSGERVDAPKTGRTGENKEGASGARR